MIQLSQIQVITNVDDYDIVTPIELNAVGNYDGVVGEIYLRGFQIDREIEGDNIDLDYFVYDSNGGTDEFGDPIDPKNGRAATYYDPSFDSNFISIEDYVRLTPDPSDGSMDATVQIQYANQISAPLLVTISISVGEGQELPFTDTQITHEKTIHNRGPLPPRPDRSGTVTDDRDRQTVDSIDYGNFTVEIDTPPLPPVFGPSFTDPPDATFSTDDNEPSVIITTDDEFKGVSPTDQVIDNILDSTEDLDIKVVVPKEEVEDTDVEREVLIETVVEKVNSLPTVLREGAITTVVEEVNSLPATANKETVIKKIVEEIVTVPTSSVEERKEVITTVVDQIGINTGDVPLPGPDTIPGSGCCGAGPKVPVVERADYVSTVVNELDAVPITTVNKEEITKKIIEEIVNEPLFYTEDKPEIITTVVEQIDVIPDTERKEVVVTVVDELDLKTPVRPPIAVTPEKEEVIPGTADIETLLNASTVEIFNETINKEASSSSRDLFIEYFGAVNNQLPLVRNTNFWGSELKNITAISPITEGVSLRNRTHGTAVTPRHVLISAHYTGQHPQQGAEMTFIDKENKVVKRSVITTKSYSYSSGEPDFAIVLLDSDLPSSIGFTRVMPADIYNGFSKEVQAQYRSGLDGYGFFPRSLIWSTNQRETSSIFKLNSLLVSGPESKGEFPVDSFNFTGYVADKIDPGYNDGQLIPGDSSSPLFANIGGEAVLIGIAVQGNKGLLTGGRNTDIINSLIRDVDLENLDSPTNYSLTNINYNILEDDIIPPTDSGGIVPGGVTPTDSGGVTPTDSGGIVTGGACGVCLPGTGPIVPGGVTPTDSGGVTPTDSGGVTPTDSGGVTPTDSGGIVPGGVTPTDSGGIVPGGTTDDGDTFVDDSFISDKINEKEEVDTTYTLTIVNNGPEDLIFVSTETQGFQAFAVGDIVKMEKKENSFSFILSKLENIEDLTFTYSQVDLVEKRRNIVNDRLSNIFQSVVISSGSNVGTIQIYQKLLPPETPDTTTEPPDTTTETPDTTTETPDTTTEVDNRDYEDILNEDFGDTTTNTPNPGTGGTVEIVNPGGPIGPITIDIDTDGTITYPGPITPGGGITPSGGGITPSGGGTTPSGGGTTPSGGCGGCITPSGGGTTPSGGGTTPSGGGTTPSGGGTTPSGGGTIPSGGGTTPSGGCGGGTTPSGGGIIPSGGCGGGITPSGGCGGGTPRIYTPPRTCIPFIDIIPNGGGGGPGGGIPGGDPPPTIIYPPDLPPIIPFIPANCGKIPVIRIGIPRREDPEVPIDIPIVDPPPQPQLLYPAPVLGLQIPFLSNVNFDTNVTLASPPSLGLVDEEEEQQEVEQVQVTANNKNNLCDEEEECNTLGF